MNLKFYFTSILFCLVLNVSAQKKEHVEVKVSAKGGSIEILAGGRVRLVGGSPIVQHKDVTFKTVEKTNQAYRFISEGKDIEVDIKNGVHSNTVGIYINPKDFSNIGGSDFSGFFFSEIKDYRDGVAFYRYKPWNSWTKPVKVSNPKELESWDNQFYYWQYKDGSYGAAVPLYGNGYRATLGSENGMFGSKAISYLDGYSSEKIPAMAIGFGTNPYVLIQQLFESAMEFAGMRDNLRRYKTFPEPMNYLGWCTWNASNLGQNLNENTILKGIESFSNNNFQLGWLLIDDGWFNHKNSQLRSFYPDSVKFPNGFKPLIDSLKNSYHLKHVGIWHALNGYWNGIDPQSSLGRIYKNEMFSWKQKERVDVESPVVTYHFLRPDSDSLTLFFNRWHRYFKSEGFSFIKVDNQLVVERMSVSNYPIGNLATSLHRAVNTSAEKFFNNAMINCMDMTSDAFYNFGKTAVARSVEDYFPYEQGENYDLQRGNAAAHILQGIYNNLYFGQMVFPDLDMFQSHNPNGEFHAIARAINNGPIYITDNVGEQNFEILKKLVYNDGRIIRSEFPLVPTTDCLFQIQDKKPFKAYSKSNGIGLLGAWNCADADEVRGELSVNDVEGLQGQSFAMYEHISGKVQIVDRSTKISVTLKRLGYKLYYFAPLSDGIALLGLLDKYNAPATIVKSSQKKGELNVTVQPGNTFGAILPYKPSSVIVNGSETKDYTFDRGLIKVFINSSIVSEIKIRL